MRKCYDNAEISANVTHANYMPLLIGILKYTHFGAIESIDNFKFPSIEVELKNVVLFYVT